MCVCASRPPSEGCYKGPAKWIAGGLSQNVRGQDSRFVSIDSSRTTFKRVKSCAIYGAGMHLDSQFWLLGPKKSAYLPTK